jgi:hypothetical protein
VKWKKSSPAAVKRFETHVAVPGADRGLMFGCPTLKLNGQLYAMLHGEDILLRLSAADRETLIEKGGRPFEPRPGTKSKKSLVLPAAIASSPRALRTWVAKAVAFAIAQS